MKRIFTDRKRLVIYVDAAQLQQLIEQAKLAQQTLQNYLRERLKPSA